MRWIIGDIHGMLAPLQGLLRAISARDPDPCLFFVGDYVNRGPDSRGVIDLLLTLTNARFARGNHDDIFDQVLTGTGYAGPVTPEQRFAAFDWFMRYGLDATLRSYGVQDSEMNRLRQRPTERALDSLVEPIPQPHRDFIRGLPLFLEDPDFFVLHAKRDPADTGPLRDLAPSAAETALWGRFEPRDLGAEKLWDHPGYFGHTPVDRYVENSSVPILAPRMVLLDTAVALREDGRLTAWCHDDRTFLQTDRAGRPLVAP